MCHLWHSHSLPADLACQGALRRRRAEHAKAYNDVFHALGLWRKTIHESHLHLAGDMNNNRIESFNGGVRNRERSWSRQSGETRP